MKKRTYGLLWIAALAVLAVVLVWVNLPERETRRAAGASVGDRLPDFSVECLDGSRFTLSEQRGKTVVINLWATWCTPCVEELLGFDRLQRERVEDVAVLALHSELVTADVAGYLSAFDYAMPFAIAPDGKLIAALNGSQTLPQTIIVDPDGVVTYNRVGALNYETLCKLVDAAG